MLQKMDRGDYLGVMCAGAYGFVIASNYNGRRKAAEVCVDGAAYSVVRERERVEDLL
jgi:diaminopimelate decarboxylase